MLRSRKGPQAQTSVRRNQGRVWGNSPRILSPPAAALLQEGVSWAQFYKRTSAHPPSRAMLALSPPRGWEQGSSGRCRPPQRCSQCPGCSLPRWWPSPSTPLPGPAASARLLSVPAAPELPPAPPCTAGLRGCFSLSGTGSRLWDRRQVTLTQGVPLWGPHSPERVGTPGGTESLPAVSRQGTDRAGNGHRQGSRQGIGRIAGRDGQHRGPVGRGGATG